MEITPELLHRKLEQKIEMEQMKIRFSNSITSEEMLEHLLKFHPQDIRYETLKMCINHNVKYKYLFKQHINKFDLLTNDEKEYLMLL